jgi:serine/threonine-protein phosphatase CPPED1
MSSLLKKYLIIILILFRITCYGQEGKATSVVQLCDTQLGMGGYENDVKSFSQAVKQINDLYPDFVIICGDLVNTPTDSSYADFKKIVKGFRMPYYCLPGNHDVGNVPNKTSLNYYRKTIGKDYYTFHKNGCYFIATNTQLWKSPLEKESEKQDKWLKERLKRLAKRNKQIIVFGHIPLYISDSEEKEVYSNFPPGKRKELLELLGQYHVAAYLSGHSHTLIINDYKGIKLVSGETTSNNFDKRPLGFRLWNVSPDSISHRFISIGTENN